MANETKKQAVAEGIRKMSAKHGFPTAPKKPKKKK